jgi:hypothetical protein
MTGTESSNPSLSASHIWTPSACNASRCSRLTHFAPRDRPGGLPEGFRNRDREIVDAQNMFRAENERSRECRPKQLRLPPSPDTSHVDDSGTVSGQFERSSDLQWNRALRNCTVFLTLPESCVWALPAFAAAEAEIVATHLGERTNFSRARVSATYIM